MLIILFSSMPIFMLHKSILILFSHIKLKFVGYYIFLLYFNKLRQKICVFNHFLYCLKKKSLLNTIFKYQQMI